MKTNCLNCGEPVALRFCPACGQAVDERRRSVFNLVGDFFAEFLALDGRLVRTAGLLWVPGRLTELYLQGKRASFVPPVRVYLVASLMFFLAVGIPTPNADDYNVYVNDVLIGRDEPVEGLGYLQLSGLDKQSGISNMIEPLILPKIGKLQVMDAQDLLDGFFGGLERTIPTALIFFVPGLALALKLLYIRRAFFYVDHLVFSLHFQSFLFVILVLAHVANLVGVSRLIPAPLTYVLFALLAMPIYGFLALRRVYGQGRILTAVKTVILAMLYLVLIQPIMLVTMLLVIRSM